MKNVTVRKTTELANDTIRIDLVFETEEFGPIVIKYLRVGPSELNKELWCQVPSIRLYGKYQPCVFFEGIGVWEKIEKLLGNEYEEYKGVEIGMNENLTDQESKELMKGIDIDTVNK